MVKVISALERALVTVRLAAPTLVTELAAFPLPSKVPHVVSTLDPRPRSEPESRFVQFPVDAEAVAVAVMPAADTVELGAVTLSKLSQPAMMMAADEEAVASALKPAMEARVVVVVAFRIFII